MGSGGSGAKGQLGLLLVLLALLGGYGTWNYQRNLEAEAKQVRPYRSYSDAELEQLRAAYQAEADQLGARYDALADSRAGSREVGLLGEAVDEFERVQRHSRAVRELGAKASQELASLQAIEEEQAHRARLGSGWGAFLRRAFLPPPS